jgi:hypothetical protein
MDGLLWADFICSLLLCVCRAEFHTLLYVSRSSRRDPSLWDHRSYALPASLESNHKLIAVMTELQKRVLAGGFLAFCLLSLFWTDDRDHKIIGLTELVALSSA